MPSATINGFKHHWEELGSGEAFILLHGAAGSSVSLMNHARELSKDFRVLVPDMRGLGQSQRVNPIPADAWVEDMRGLLNHLAIDSAHVYGTSLGARVALRFAIAYPKMTNTLILENSIIAFEAAGNDAMNARLGNPDAMAPEVAERYRGMHGEDWKDAVLAYFAWRNDASVHAYYDMREASKSLTMPTLLTRGDAREPVHPMSHTFEIFENIKSARLWIKPEGGCFATPEGYARVRAFIAESAKTPVGA